MKTLFIYHDPHPVHAKWAKQMNAEFFPYPRTKSDKLNHVKAMFTKIPEADVYLLESPAFTPILPRNGVVIAINSDPFFYEYERWGLIPRFFWKRQLSKVHKFISTSQMMLDLAKRNTLENRFIIHELRYPTVDKKWFKVKLNKDARDIVFVSGLLNKQKGVDRLIRLFELIKNNNKLYLVGEPTPDIVKMVKDKEDIILTGKVTNPEFYMKKCKYYFNLARFEPFGLNIMEAKAMGLNPIVSNMCGAKELL